MIEQIKRCPYCDNEIRLAAKKCQFCGEWLEEKPTTGQSTIQNPETLLRQALGDKYEIQGVIGKGGMATVYKAVQKNLNRVVALKVIHQNLVHDTEFVSRFIREAQVSASLNHPNIVTVYDVGSVGSVHYMAMELLEGEDLHQMVKRKGALNHNDVVKWMIPVADALDYIHQKKLLHRDIKSSNILITKEGRPVLMDFGIAHAADGTKLTQTGTVVGTPEYMSPEQAEGKPMDNRSDLYSLGVVMYECLTGKVPFKGDNPLTTIHLLSSMEPERPENINHLIPDWLSEIVLKLLFKKIEYRLLSGEDLAASLKKKKLNERNIIKKKQLKNNPTQKIDNSKKEITNKRNRAVKWIIPVIIIVLVQLTINLIVKQQVVTSKESKIKQKVEYKDNPTRDTSRINKNSTTNYFQTSKLGAIILARSNVILQGEVYEAEVFLAAEDTTQQPMILINNRQVDVKDGKAIYRIRANEPGVYSWSGLIKCKTPDGIVRNYPFEQEFQVIKPSVKMSATNMNIFYKGLDNLFAVEGGGIPQENIEVQMTNGSVVKSGDGYVIYPDELDEQGNRTVVSVYASIGGEKRLLGTSDWRVKRVPDPVAQVAGKSGGEIRKQVLRSQDGIIAMLKDSDLDFKYRVTQFTVLAPDAGGFTNRWSSNSNRFTEDQKAQFGRLNSNEIVYIGDIKAIGDDGETRDLDPISFVIK